jgi:hypothetical protein
MIFLKLDRIDPLPLLAVVPNLLKLGNFRCENCHFTVIRQFLQKTQTTPIYLKLCCNPCPKGLVMQNLQKNLQLKLKCALTIFAGKLTIANCQLWIDIYCEITIVAFSFFMPNVKLHSCSSKDSKMAHYCQEMKFQGPIFCSTFIWM